jgi:HEAT repeat protein
MKHSLLNSIVLLLAVSLSQATVLIPRKALESEDYTLRQETQTRFQIQIANAGETERAQLETALIALLQEESVIDSTRIWAIRTLALYGTDAAVPTLSKLLDDSNDVIHDSARKALVSIPGETSAKVLINALEHQPDASKQPFVEAVADRGLPAAVPLLAPLMDSPLPGLANASIQALGSIGGPDARSVLTSRRESCPEGQHTVVELALIQAGLTNSMARLMATSGSNHSIRAAALQSLIASDPAAAEEVIDAVLASQVSDSRNQLLRTVLYSDFRDSILSKLAGLNSDDQLVVLGAIIDQDLSAYEGDVLKLLVTEDEAVRQAAVFALGFVGGERSLDPLIAIYEADDDDQLVTNALARLRCASLDNRLMDALKSEPDATALVSALRLATLRNPEGLVDQVNQLAGPDYPQMVREAAFRSMESIGNIESVQLLLSTIVQLDAFTRPAQRSLKKLSINMAIPVYQWDKAYKPMLEQTQNPEAVAAILAIIDGVSCEASTEYVKGIIQSDPELRQQALKALVRWRDISAGPVWIELAADPSTSEADMKTAITGMERILSQGFVRGEDEDKVLLAVEAVQSVNDPGFKKTVVGVYDVPAKKLKWGKKRQILESFPELLDDPDIGKLVQSILDRLE